MDDKIQKAREGEEIACTYLSEQGYRIIERNYRVGHGEIDIIADDHGMFVFIEVKTRLSQSYGPPEYSITPGKQKQLRRVAQGYFYQNEIVEMPCRFDVVTIEFQNRTPRINHIQNAFTFYDR